jgi:hypothetical protein
MRDFPFRNFPLMEIMTKGLSPTLSRTELIAWGLRVIASLLMERMGIAVPDILNLFRIMREKVFVESCRSRRCRMKCVIVISNGFMRKKPDALEYICMIWLIDETEK